jgi:hypothetical protein
VVVINNIFQLQNFLYVERTMLRVLRWSTQDHQPPLSFFDTTVLIHYYLINSQHSPYYLQEYTLVDDASSPALVIRSPSFCPYLADFGPVIFFSTFFLLLVSFNESY